MSDLKGNNNLARARQDDLAIQELPDEVLVYDLRKHKAHCLNQTAAFVWNHCDGNKTVNEIAVLMAEEWGKPVTEEVIWLALKQLSKADLLQEAVVPNGDGMRVSRRSVLKTLGAAAAMTPLVISVIAPTASAGASVPLVCQTCIKKNGDALACPTDCLNVVGQCFDNAGCGQGQAIGCQTCGVCQGSHGAADTVSWVAPGGC
jgi:hypothetical protein